jgi:alanine dehydrogenase
VLHYCVSNMPAAVPHTSTFALTNATLPYLMALAGKGLERACQESRAIYEGVNTYKGHVVCAAAAESLGRPSTDLSALL